MSGYSFYGRDVIAQRGYTNGSLTPFAPGTVKPSGNVYSKITFEIRYPAFPQSAGNYLRTWIS